MTGAVFDGQAWYGVIAAAVTGLTVIIARVLDHRAARRTTMMEESVTERETLLKEWHSIRDALRQELQVCHQERDELRGQMDSLRSRVEVLERGGRGRNAFYDPPDVDIGGDGSA